MKVGQISLKGKNLSCTVSIGEDSYHMVVNYLNMTMPIIASEVPHEYKKEESEARRMLIALWFSTASQLNAIHNTQLIDAM